MLGNDGIRSRKSTVNPIDVTASRESNQDGRLYYTPQNSPDTEKSDFCDRLHYGEKSNLHRPVTLSNVEHLHHGLLHTDDEEARNEEGDNPNSPPPIHDWEEENADAVEFFDDGTMTYFWRAHTITTLFLMVMFLLYEALSTPDDDVVDNTKRGLVAMVMCFTLLGVTMTPDGPFKRPHPAVWRLTFTFSIVYELVLIFVLYQNASTARKMLKHLDPSLGEPLEEKDYGGNCLLYDPGNPAGAFHNIWDKMDVFVPLHLIGWWCKTLLLRDWWLCCVVSVMFEVLEYTLEHQLPNFSECWWDHWIMDAFICNGLGIYCGLKTLNHFSMKTYHWRGLWNIPTYRGKLRRILGQFGPYMWVDFDWKPSSTLGRWGAVLAIIATFLLVELNTFYLKFVLWIPHSHWVNLCRLLLVMPWGAVALRETFQYLDDPDVLKIGRQCWIFFAVICTELLIVVKFGWDTVTIPFSGHIIALWTCIFAVLLLWTLWHFYIDPHTIKVNKSMSEEQRRLHWSHVRAIETKLSPSEFYGQAFSLKLLTAKLTSRIADTITTITTTAGGLTDGVDVVGRGYDMGKRFFATDWRGDGKKAHCKEGEGKNVVGKKVPAKEVCAGDNNMKDAYGQGVMVNMAGRNDTDGNFNGIQVDEKHVDANVVTNDSTAKAVDAKSGATKASYTNTPDVNFSNKVSEADLKESNMGICDFDILKTDIINDTASVLATDAEKTAANKATDVIDVIGTATDKFVASTVTNAAARDIDATSPASTARSTFLNCVDGERYAMRDGEIETCGSKVELKKDGDTGNEGCDEYDNIESKHNGVLEKQKRSRRNNNKLNESSGEKLYTKEERSKEILPEGKSLDKRSSGDFFSDRSENVFDYKSADERHKIEAPMENTVDDRLHTESPVEKTVEEKHHPEAMETVDETHHSETPMENTVDERPQAETPLEKSSVVNVDDNFNGEQDFSNTDGIKLNEVLESGHVAQDNVDEVSSVANER